ncbi:MAG: hypothetical protein BWY77_01676 [bacterium ADurb.Bin431]|nr:MAG: hypothetical protein BWY77_01676 [bacterium ADurb.Bin431]
MDLFGRDRDFTPDLVVEKLLDEELGHQGCFIFTDTRVAVKAEPISLQGKELLPDHIVQIGGLWIGAFFQEGHAKFIIAAEFGYRDDPVSDSSDGWIPGLLFPAAAGGEEKDRDEKERHMGCSVILIFSRCSTAAGEGFVAMAAHLTSTIFPVLVKAPASRRKK